MTRLYDSLTRVQADLRALGVRWALVGGLAVSARAEPRTTRDADIVVSVFDDKGAEKLIWALKQRGYTPLDPFAHFEQTAAGRLATVRLVGPGADEIGGNVVDLLFASSGIEPEVVDAAEPLEVFPGLAVPVATTGHLVALKVLAAKPTRPQDTTDALALLALAAPADLQQARDGAAGGFQPRGRSRDDRRSGADLPGSEQAGDPGEDRSAGNRRSAR